MDNTEQLIIRACKSENPSQRIKSVYRRFYLKNEIESVNIAYILARICDKYFVCKFIDIIYDLGPTTGWEHIGIKNLNYYDRVVKVLISKIRFTKD